MSAGFFKYQTFIEVRKVYMLPAKNKDEHARRKADRLKLNAACKAFIQDDNNAARLIALVAAYIEVEGH